MHLEIKSMARWCCCQEKNKELRYGILKSHQGGITSVNFNITLHPLKYAIFGISNLKISFYILSCMSFRMYWIILLPELSPAAAAKSLQSCPTLCDPIDGSPPGSPVPGTLQARTLSGLWFPSPVHESEKWKGSRSVMSDSSWPHGLQPTRLLHPWDSPGKSTRVGCPHLLQNWFLVDPYITLLHLLK